MIFEEIIFQDSGLSHSPIFCSESPQLTIGIFTIQILYHLLNYLHMFIMKPITPDVNPPPTYRP